MPNQKASAIRRAGDRTASPLGALVLALALSGCESSGSGPSSGPIIYPDSYAREVGYRAVQADIADCRRLARQWGAGGRRAGPVARDTALGAAMGGAAAGVYGAVRGDHDAGERALAGAAAGAAAGMIRGAARATEPAPVHRRFVERCLTDRGYEVMGWR